MSTKMVDQALNLITYLSAHPDSTRAEVEAKVLTAPGSSAFPALVQLIRNKVGAEVVVTAYDKSRGAYVYRLATTAEDGHKYVLRRKQMVRNTVQNLVGICDRILARHGSEPEIALTRTLLSSIVAILDATDTVRETVPDTVSTS